MLAPTLAFGASDHHLPFGGTLSLGATTFAARPARPARRRRPRPGSGACSCSTPTAATAPPARSPSRRQRASSGLVAATALGSDLIDPGEVEGPISGHAGSFETSLVLALDPDRVRPDLARPSPGGPARARRPRPRRRRSPAAGRSSTASRIARTRRRSRAASRRSRRYVAAVAAAFEQLADVRV